MGIQERKEREKIEMRNLILDSAMKLFLNEGFERVTIRKIADQIEYSAATVYLYFKDKNEILCALQARGFDLFFERQLRITNEPNPLERLRRLGLEYMQFAFEFPEYYELMFIFKAPMTHFKQGENWEDGMRTFRFLVDVVKDCIEKELLPKADPYVVSVMLWSLVHGMVSLCLEDRLVMIPEEERKNMLRSGLDYFIKTLTA